MKIHEYQAKKLLSQFGIQTPQGQIAKTPSQAGKIAEEIGFPVVLKAQIHAGGRGKAGGIKTAKTAAEAERIAKSLLGTRLVTHQTGPEGLLVDTVLIEESVKVQRELYLSMLIDTRERLPLLIATGEGGTEIEEVAARNPEKLLKRHIDPVAGILPYQCRRLAYDMNLSLEKIGPATQIMSGMYKLFTQKDCTLVEINPLAITADRKFLAIDAKVNFDDNALFRHPEIAELKDTSQEDPLEIEAESIGVSYIKLSGNIGCMVNGAGLAMATMDLIKWAGGEPANFLDVGGDASEEQIAGALALLLSDAKVKVVWVNVFGGILRCDLVARAIIRAFEGKDTGVPLVVRMRGTNVSEATRLLEESGLRITLEPDLTEAARKAVAIASAAREET